MAISIWLFDGYPNFGLNSFAYLEFIVLPYEYTEFSHKEYTVLTKCQQRIPMLIYIAYSLVSAPHIIFSRRVSKKLCPQPFTTRVLKGARRMVMRVFSLHVSLRPSMAMRKL